MKKLALTIALTVAVFVAAFAAGFFTIGRAMAQPESETPQEDSTNAPAGDHATPDAHDAHGAHGGHGDPSKHFRYVGPPFGHNSKDVQGGKFGDGEMTDPHTGETTPGEEQMSAPFIYMVLNFALLLFILMKFGAPIVRRSTAERHDQIKTALDEAAKLRKQAADKLDEYESRLKDADSEIKKLVDGLRADAEADKARILENAERQAVQMKRDAEQRIAAEIELARATLTREVTAAASAASEKLLRAKMTPGDQQKLVGTFITDIQTTTTREIR
jgi:F-type H+-transporting ATPase subunit b